MMISGTTDSTAGLQLALDDAKQNHFVAFFPDGVYLISNTLTCYHYELWDPATGAAGNPNHRIYMVTGSKLSTMGRTRPVIKINPASTNFDDTGKLRPMIAYRMFKATNSSGTTAVAPANAFDDPANFESLRLLYGSIFVTTFRLHSSYVRNSCESVFSFAGNDESRNCSRR